MSILYNYEIIKVDEAARVMEVVYTSEGRQTMHIGARLPYEGESLEAVIQMFSPVPYWLEQEAQTLPVAVGITGTIGTPVEVTLESTKQAKLAEIAAARYGYEISGVRVNQVQIRTDRESQAAINGAYVALLNGVLETVDWKGSDGKWVPLTLAEAKILAQAVAEHVQSAFSIEKQLTEQVNVATTIEDVETIKWPL